MYNVQDMEAKPDTLSKHVQTKPETCNKGKIIPNIKFQYRSNFIITFKYFRYVLSIQCVSANISQFLIQKIFSFKCEN